MTLKDKRTDLALLTNGKISKKIYLETDVKAFIKKIKAKKIEVFKHWSPNGVMTCKEVILVEDIDKESGFE